MARKEPLSTQIFISLRAALMFALIVAGSTYYLQSSLLLYKQFGSHIHWSVVLVALPLLAGLLVRLARVTFPLLSIVVGVAVSAAILYPSYRGFWAIPPSRLDLAIYVVIVLGLGYIATQPLRTTFMAAFHLGKFAVPPFSARSGGTTRNAASRNLAQGKGTQGKSVRKTAPLSKTQRLEANKHGDTIALLELLVGVTSLVLSIFSIFFLGRG